MRVAYIDFDSCYYNLARRIYGISPWTIITNEFNHTISVPHWLNGHFGVKKMTYFSPSARVVLKIKRFVRVFNVDRVPGARDAMVESIKGELEKVKAFAPGARIAHKDSIIAEVGKVGGPGIAKVLSLPCTVGLGQSEKEAKEKCETAKKRKKNNATATALLAFWVLPMITHYIMRLVRRKINGYQEDINNVLYTS